METKDVQLELEEWKEAQLIVKHQEGIVYRIRGWIIALLTALSVAVLKQDPTFLSPTSYAFLALALVAVFYVLEMYLRVPLHRAIRRTRQIEKAIRGEDTYDSLRLSEMLGQGSDLADMKEFCFRGRLVAPYIALVIMATVTTIIAANS